MRILSIETSCDETAVCILEASGDAPEVRFNVLANITLSQAKLHAEYGGVFPRLAKREHAKNLVPVFKQALEDAGMFRGAQEKNIEQALAAKLEALLDREPEMLADFLAFIAGVKKPPIDIVAVTKGPGLEPALWVGVNFAKALSFAWDIPVVPINHMEGHILSSVIGDDKNFTLPTLEIPALALLISGGHTELVLMRDWMRYEVIGQTRDDAVGEAFDKVARMLELPYPGGPEISKIAEEAPYTDAPPYPLPRPMLTTDDFDFSFSGLKTAVLYTIKKIPELAPKTKAAIAREFEEAVTEILLKKTLRAVEAYGAKTLIIGGGVSANKRIRESFIAAVKTIPETKLYIPDRALSTDNALMIAVAGYLRAQEKLPLPADIRAEGNLTL